MEGQKQLSLFTCNHQTRYLDVVATNIFSGHWGVSEVTSAALNRPRVGGRARLWLVTRAEKSTVFIHDSTSRSTTALLAKRRYLDVLATNTFSGHWQVSEVTSAALNRPQCANVRKGKVDGAKRSRHPRSRWGCFPRFVRSARLLRQTAPLPEGFGNADDGRRPMRLKRYQKAQKQL